MLVVVVGHRWSSMVNTLAEGAGNLLFSSAGSAQQMYGAAAVCVICKSVFLCFQTSVSSVSQQVQLVSVCF